MHHRFFSTNGIRLHTVQAGPEEGPLVVLLHGFPEFWYSWRKQIPFLAAAGYRVLVPDLRGYNYSDKPRGIAAYSLPTLAADVRGLIKALGRERASVVGHDWGAGVAWWIALTTPQWLERLVILNAPHPFVFQQNLLHNPVQLSKSWYIFFFQIPWLPEALTSRGNWRLAVQALRSSSRPGTFSDEDLEIYRQAWSQSGAYSAMVNWYRAILQKQPSLPDSPHIALPTLLIWGAQDQFLGREMAEPSSAFCTPGDLVILEEASHWVHHEEADRVNHLVRSYLT